MYELRCYCGQEGTHSLENEVGDADGDGRTSFAIGMILISSNPATHHPVSVVQGNSTSISAMVQVDNNLEFSEEAFRFLINQIQDDLPGMTLPR